jgi:hypothetical protein
VNRPARNSGRRGRTGNYGFIKQAGEAFESDGIAGDSHLRLTFDALQSAIATKRSRLGAYRSFGGEAWLLLLDDAYPGAFEETFAQQEWREKLRTVRERSGFEQVLLYDFSSGPRNLGE